MLESLSNDTDVQSWLDIDIWVHRTINATVAGELNITDIQNRISLQVEDQKYDGKIFFYFEWEVIGFIEYDKSRKWTIVIEYFSNINFNNKSLQSNHPSHNNLVKYLSNELFWDLKINWLWTYMFEQFLGLDILNGKDHIVVDSLIWSESFYYKLWFEKSEKENRLEYRI